jgi:hypothetical protein
MLSVSHFFLNIMQVLNNSKAHAASYDLLLAQVLNSACLAHTSGGAEEVSSCVLSGNEKHCNRRSFSLDEPRVASGVRDTDRLPGGNGGSKHVKQCVSNKGYFMPPPAHHFVINTITYMLLGRLR